MNKLYDENILSDLYKEAYGYRPRADYFEHWDELTVEQKNAEWQYLLDYAQAEAERERAIQEANLAEWNKHVTNLMNTYGVDRETAIRWDMEAMKADDDLNGGEDYYRWLWDIPFRNPLYQ